MCGIVTIFSPQRPIHPDVLAQMTETLHHRGPDDFAYGHVDIARSRYRSWRGAMPGNEWLAGVLFGHRRLSILDLSSAGRQPMVSADESLVLAYNGEIYNFIDCAKSSAPAVSSSARRPTPRSYCRRTSAGARTVSHASTGCGRSPSGMAAGVR